jgi:predicted HTH transcriptional regulator
MQPFPDLTGLTAYPEWEGQTLEFKASLDKGCKDKLYPTICAFLNTKGGRIIFGIEDAQRLIVGIDADSKKFDGMFLSIDNIYHTKIIVDEENKPPAIGQITTNVIDLANGRKLFVVDVLPQEKLYKTADGTTWFRLSASNYRMTSESSNARVEALARENVDLSMRLEKARAELSSMNRSLADTNQKLKDCKSQRDSNYTKMRELQEQFKTFAGAAKGMEERFTNLTAALEKEILARKEEAEEELAARKSWWNCCCL